MFYIISHAFHCDRFQPWQSWQPHLAKATEKGCGNMWNVKTLGSLGMKIFRFFFQDSCAFLTISLLQGLSKDSPRILQSQSFACCAVRFPASRPQGMRLDKHIKPLKVSGGWTAQKNQKESTRRKKFVVTPTWFLVSILRCILYRLHIVCTHLHKKDNLSTGPHLESQCAHVDHMRRLGLCDVQHLAPPCLYVENTWHKHDLNPFQTLEDASFQM